MLIISSMSSTTTEGTVELETCKIFNCMNCKYTTYICCNISNNQNTISNNFCLRCFNMGKQESAWTLTYYKPNQYLQCDNTKCYYKVNKVPYGMNQDGNIGFYHCQDNSTIFRCLDCYHYLLHCQNLESDSNQPKILFVHGNM